MLNSAWVRRWCWVCTVGVLGTEAAWSDEAVVPAASQVAAVEADPSWTTGALAPVSYEWQPCGPAAACPQHAGCGCNCQNQTLFGFIAPSDRCFSDFVSPLSNPLFFEDPRNLTEARVVFANQWIPDGNPVFNGGNAQYVATQLRIALTERLSIVANKDGYLWIDSNNEAAIPDGDGWADVTAGLKYNLVRDPESQFLLSVGTIYEIDIGSHHAFQGRGDGEFHIFTSAGKQIGGKAHFLSGTGFRLPTDTAARSQMWYWSNHIDYEFVESWYALFEVNWFHWMKSGKALPVNFEGGDLINLGSTDVAGNDMVTMAIGARKKFGSYSELGVGYEIPVSERKDLMRSRLYADLIIRY